MEQSEVTNLANFTEPIPAEVSPVEINAPTEKEKKVEQLMRMGAVQIPGFPYIVQLRKNGNKVDATSDEGRPSELAHQEHVPEFMTDPTSEPSAPAPRAYWIVPKDPVPNIGLQFHNSKECEQLLPAVSIDEQGTSGSSQFIRGGSVMLRDPEKEARKKKSLSFCENMTEEQKKEYKDTMKFARNWLLNHMQAEEENKRKSTTEALTSFLENSQSALELNLPTVDNSSKITEQSAVANLAEPVPAKVDPVETSASTKEETLTNVETLLEMADRLQLAAVKPYLEQFIIGSDMDRFEKIRIAEKHQLENLLNNGIMEFNGDDVLSKMELNTSYTTISDKVKFQILCRILRMKE
ncbi:hypothetical protein GCK72_020974 [Caenorhabditis remanei]|uniref:Uncharacterized protein n=1 Tax=Caenorhabditis remanei TaxID=31234 RepID=A0A6A5GIA6_CAERE|nr:hypothetical protein GCK72_020974 [Caenorhabditis remanei]KAF1754413.1 hypothetical protein GCK72_020974 [Caenorhabditis remanei]